MGNGNGWEIDVHGFFMGDSAGYLKSKFTPERILCSGNRTIVFWKDGSKTVVKRADDEDHDLYNAFTAALAKKIFGSNNALKSTIEAKTEKQIKKHKTKHINRQWETTVRAVDDRTNRTMNIFRCPECGYESMYEFAFCPHCGACMVTDKK